MEILFGIVGLIVILVLGGMGKEEEQSGLRRMLIRRRIRAAQGLRRVAKRRRERKAARQKAPVAEVRPVRDPGPVVDRLPIVETLPEAEPEPPPAAAPVPEPVVHTPPPAPPPEPEPEPPAAEPPPARLEVVDLVRDLIAADVSGSARDRLFAERFADREVRWSGELQRVDTYRQDSTFGDGPGVRIVVLVHEIHEGNLSGREVRAVVQLPPEGESLRSCRGETVAFTGRLVRYDSFMRDLYVADGRLAV